MQAAAAALTRSLDQLTTGAMATRYDDATAKQVLAFLSDPSRETNDFATSRQAAWAIRELATDLGWADAGALFLRGSEDPLALSLPSGQDRSVMDNLSRWLPAAARYDAEWFRAELKAVQTKLVP